MRFEQRHPHDARVPSRPIGTERRARSRFGGCIAAATGALLLALTATGCALPRRQPNPSFNLTREEARADLARMAAAPKPAQRPIVFLAGIGDPAISSSALRVGVMPTLARPSGLPETTPAVVELDFFGDTSFEGARQRALRGLAEAFGVSPERLPEVDVVAFSMGGLVARDLAIPDAAGRRLPIRRLYTVCSPHEGARLAGVLMGIPVGADMCPTSDFMARLAAAPRDYELVCYARLDDVTVGEEFAAPTGEPLWWLPTNSGEWAHMSAFKDPRFHADIARRLRGDEPWTRLPAAPLPN